MIYNYEIKKQDGEEILYLYLEFNYEFAKLNAKAKEKKLSQIINEFLKEKRIPFYGKKIAIVVGGLVVSTILLTNVHLKYDSISNTNTPEYQYSIIMEKDAKTVEESKQELEIKEDINQSTEEKKEEFEIDAKTNNNIVASNPLEKEELGQEETDNDITTNNNVYVTLKRSNGTIIDIELEEYIIGVVAAEMPASFHQQALMAQAVIARTYALRTLERTTILTDNSSTQNYKDNNELQNMWGSNYNTYYQKIKNAVNNTKGIYLTYEGNIIEAVYHSTSNGYTEDSKYVWGNSFPYLVSVESPYDTTNSSFQVDKYISYEELTEKLQMEINISTEFNVISKTISNRIEKILINDKTYTGVNIRNQLGLRSTDFEIKKEENGITFTTRGYGHGVGMSQYGANGMAKNGYNYEQILKHYYQEITLSS